MTTIEAGTVSDAWLRRFHPVPGAAVRLLCLPHAGGASSFYFPISAALSALPGAPVEPLAVQYPGRQDRRHEPAMTSIQQLAAHITDAVGPYLDRPLAVFGHSMGALVGFEVARRLEARGHVPAVLVVSGRRPPGTAGPAGDLHRRPDAEVLAEVMALHGTSPGLLDDEEIVRMILPALRADYTAVETYVHRAGPLTCPITAFAGDADPRVTPAETDGWAACTRAAFSRRVFSGGHFYLGDRPAEVAAAIAAALPSPGTGRS